MNNIVDCIHGFLGFGVFFPRIYITENPWTSFQPGQLCAPSLPGDDPAGNTCGCPISSALASSGQTGAMQSLLSGGLQPLEAG